MERGLVLVVGAGGCDVVPLVRGRSLEEDELLLDECVRCFLLDEEEEEEEEKEEEEESSL